MDNLTPELHYATYLDRLPEGPRRLPCVSPVELAKLLPHGSGIDGNWHIHVLRNGNVTVSGEYHEMDEGGSYCGWRSFSFRIFRHTKDRLHALHGPCEGMFQVLARRGDVSMSDVRLDGRPDHNDLGEYLVELLHDALRPILTPFRNETVTDAREGQ